MKANQKKYYIKFVFDKCYIFVIFMFKRGTMCIHFITKFCLAFSTKYD